MDWKYLLGSFATGALGLAVGIGIGLSNKKKEGRKLPQFEKLDHKKPNVFVIKGEGTHSCVIQSFTYQEKNVPGWYLGYLVYNSETKKWDEFRKSAYPLDDNTIAYDIANLIHNEEVDFVRNEEEFNKALDKYGAKFSWSAFTNGTLKTKDEQNEVPDTNDVIEIKVEPEHKLKND